MKKFLFIFVLIFSISIFVSCKTLNKTTYSLDEYVASEISKIENIQNYNDETIKTLSIIYRSNLKYSEEGCISKIDQNILNLIKQTSPQSLNKTVVINTDNSVWSEIINKSEILEFFKSNNQNLSSMKDLKIINDRNNTAQKLSIASKEIDFKSFANYFNLPSNKNIEIEEANSFYKLSGYGKGFNIDIDINDIENLAEKNLNHNEILEILL